MTLPAFLVAAADSKFVWLGFKRLAVPAATSRWSLRRTLGMVAVHTAVAITLACIIALAIAGRPWGWLMWLLGLFAACQGIVVVGLMALCWNQRVARLRENPELPLRLPPARYVTIRWLLGLIYIGLLAVITPVAMLLTVENVRGQLAWSWERAQLAAQGERMTVREILGPEIPAAQNAGAAPVFAPFFDYPRDGGYHPSPEVTNALARFREAVYLPTAYLPERPSTPKVAPKHPQNLEEWSAAYRKLVASPTASDPPWAASLKLPASGNPARDVLAGLAPGDAIVAEVCAAAALPRAQFPVHWEQGFDVLLQHLANLKQVQINLKLRCAAHLAVEETDAAFADATNALNVAELLREEPFLISQLVRFANGALATSTLWEGLVQHRWSDTQLSAFQERLTRVDYLSGLILGFEGERACSAVGLDNLISNQSSQRQNAGGFDFRRLAILVPFGMLRQNQVALARYQTDFLTNLRALQTRPPQTGLAAVIKAQEENEEARFARMSYSPFTVLLKQLVPATAKAEARAAKAQTMNHLAITVCALERYRLAHGNYPETLDVLVPTFMLKPLSDPMNGQPFHYRRTDDGWFLLYSVGDDGKDDGGVFRTKPKGPILDWPWPVPTRPEVGSLF